MNEQFLAALQAENLPVSLDESLGGTQRSVLAAMQTFFVCLPR